MTALALPDLPCDTPGATLLRWLIQPGATVARGDPLLIVLTDRAEVLLPAEASGVVQQLEAAEGQQLAFGATLATFTAASTPDQTTAVLSSHVRVTPLARKLAAVHAIDARSVQGSGPSGRVTRRDVQAVLDRRRETEVGGRETATLPEVPLSQSSLLVPRSSLLAPTVLTAVQVDLGAVMDYRTQQAETFARRGLVLTEIACVAFVALAALRLHPLLNARWSDEGIVLRRRMHLGIAFPTTTGVVRDAGDLNLRGLVRAWDALARRARADQFDADAGHDATFVVASIAPSALWCGAPPLEAFRSPVLGLGAVTQHVAVVDDCLAIRPQALLTLTYDARVLAQAQADAFLRDVQHGLERFV